MKDEVVPAIVAIFNCIQTYGEFVEANKALAKHPYSFSFTDDECDELIHAIVAGLKRIFAQERADAAEWAASEDR